MTENLTPETDDVEAHRQQVRREFTEQTSGRGRTSAPVDGGDDDVRAHMTKVPFGKRESFDEDEDVRAHSSQPEDDGDAEAHGLRAVVDGEDEDAEAHIRHLSVDGDDDAEKNARRL